MLNWSPEEAKDAAREGHRAIAQFLLEEWDNPHAVDQAIGAWKDSLLAAGIDFDNPDHVWLVAITIERVYALIVNNVAECGVAEHIMEHINYGLAPLILTTDSAITRHDGA